MHLNPAFIYAFLTFFTFGLLPIFWRQLGHLDPYELTAYRALGSALCFWVYLCVARKSVTPQLNFKKYTVLAAVFLALNSVLFIEGMIQKKLLDISLGYFMSPLFSVALGFVFLKEKMSRPEKIAAAMALMGVVYWVYSVGSLPLLSILLPLTWGLYGVCRKKNPFPYVESLLSENVILSIPAFLFLCVRPNNLVFHPNLTNLSWFFWIGFFTALPLIFFSLALKNLRLTSLFFFQFIGPTLNLLIAVFMFKEPFEPFKLVSFGCVWLSLIVFLISKRANPKVTSSIDQSKIQGKFS